VIVQERAAGALIALSVVLDRDGSAAARCFQPRAIRLWPAAAGASSLSVSVEPDPELVDRAAAMLRDVNVRFYGSLPLATAAGVNLSAVWHQGSVGGRPAPPPAYRLGVRYRWLEGELVVACKGEPRRLATRPARGGAGAMWSAEDPVPGVLLALGAARAYAGGAVRRLARRGGAASARG
jgi:hypothetical protein